VRERFDRDELGLDPEEDQDDELICPECGETIEDCECDEEI
jgi:hypothetical protein